MPQPQTPKSKAAQPIKEGGLKSPEKKSFGDAAPAREGGMVDEGGASPPPKRDGGMLGEG